MNEDRLIELETKLAYQEETIRVLNEMVTQLQAQVSDQQRLLRSLGERVLQISDGAGKASLADEIPPHY
jgi:SlyX protein